MGMDLFCYVFGVNQHQLNRKVVEFLSLGCVMVELSPSLSLVLDDP